MIELTGKYNKAKVCAVDRDETALKQLLDYLNLVDTAGTKIRVMADYHAGAGCVIGFTSTLGDKVIPNLIGVDIGCGLLASPFDRDVDFGKLDEALRREIPFGMNVNNSVNIKDIEKVYSAMSDHDLDFDNFLAKLSEIASKIGVQNDRVIAAIGSLGGGNHFISVNEGKSRYLVAHSGSRNFGKSIADYYQNKARSALVSQETIKRGVEKIKQETTDKRELGEKIKIYRQSIERANKPRDLEWLSDQDKEDYFSDMKIAQTYARLNRRVMISKLREATGLGKLNEAEAIESVHNYVDFGDKIIRKGAIRAHKGEACLIPLNMADGILLCVGKGNEEFNYSAPHGAGRVMSRTQAKEAIAVSDYQARMQKSGVWSSCVGAATLDEAPQAYKDPKTIEDAIGETASITERLKEIYNFKAE